MAFDTTLSQNGWKLYEKVIFRFFFILLIALIVPLDWKYYQNLFEAFSTSTSYGVFFYLVRYVPAFGTEPRIQDLFLIALNSAAVAGAWSLIDRKERNYSQLYYWLRVAARYKLALALAGYALLKIFSMQMPEPSISNLNTNYGDITHWKAFSMSGGIVPGYESFLGWVELSAGLLLLFRRTAWVGAFTVLLFTGNVFMSNLAYEGGETVYSVILLLFGLFIFSYDVPRLYRLTVQFTEAKPDFVSPQAVKGPIRLALKSLVIIIIGIAFILAQKQYSDGGYQYPRTPGLTNAAGIYRVKELKVNGNPIQPSLTDSLSWRDVVFEKWNTLSVRSTAKVVLARNLTEEITKNDSRKNYEYAGIAGRQYYTYEADTVRHTLQLSNRNPNYTGDNFLFTYSRPDTLTILLEGVSSRGDSVSLRLEKIQKKYLLNEARKSGRRNALKL